MEMTTAVTRLSALAHGGRLSAFRLLIQAGAGGLAAGEIARSLSILPNTLSTHLAILEQAGLARSHREGRSIIYSANFDAIQGLLAFLLDDCCGGAPEICGPLNDRLRQATACGEAGVPDLEAV